MKATILFGAALFLMNGSVLFGHAALADFGAIATSTADPGKFGVATKKDSRHAAENEALAKCDNPDCTIKVYFENGCAAYARSFKPAYGVASRSNSPEAESWALDFCRAYSDGGTCKVVISTCSGDDAQDEKFARLIAEWNAEWKGQPASLVSTAQAQEIKQMDIVDFLVDWQDYIGKPVLVTGGKVVTASPDYAGLSARAGNVTLNPPWLDKEDLRFILRNCAGVGTGDRCKMTVGGTVQPANFGDGPSLTSVDFIVPQ